MSRGTIKEPFYPSFEEYFLYHGRKDRKPRIVRPFHHEVCEALRLLIRGRLPDGKKNLMLLMPPRHGKTFLVRDFVTYGLGIFPDSQWIYTSYASILALAQTYEIKQTLDKDWYKATFEVRLEKEGVEYFKTTQDGSVYGVGVGGAIAGFGAGLNRPFFGGAIIIDDPIKSDDARSKVVKEHAAQWYDGVLASRKNYKDTPIILIQHRLAPDDLVGHILRTEPEDWHILKIRGLTPDGEAIWPEVKPASEIVRLKIVDEFTYSSQYMQEPMAEGGNLIKRDWWKYYRTEGTDEQGKPINYYVKGLVFVTADTAMKVKTKNDFTVFAAWHATQKNLDLLDLRCGKWEFPEMMRRAKQFWETWRPWGAKTFYIEDKVSGTSLGQALLEQKIPAVLWSPKDYYFPDDKVGRVKMTTWYVEAGRIRLPAEKPQICDLTVEQCAAFTGEQDEHDDVVDALTMAASVWTYKGGGEDVKAA
jgi:predicted phage terminase large subunit-like protein